MDSDLIELIAERAAQRAIDKHEEKNKDQLKDLQSLMKQHITDTIDHHAATCPVGLDYRTCKAKLWGFAVGVAGGSSGLTVLIQKLLGV
jgi:hypothetical protein